MNWLAITAIALPGAMMFVLGLLWLSGAELRERPVARLTSGTYIATTICLIVIGWSMIWNGPADWVLPVGTWFRVGGYSFDVALHFDRISMAMLLLTSILTGLIGAFSRTYMHREPGFYRFFFLLHMFGFGAMVAFSAAHLDQLVAGWEMVGLSSVLLIAFFYQRTGPVSSGLRVFGTYRSADIGLLVGVFLIHHWRHSATLLSFTQHELSPTQATIAGLLLLLAAMGKAAQVPFSAWLPIAMEGPTPSSAIFYGAISVHLGAYLLLRTRPLLSDAPIALAAVTVIGLATAVHALIVGRACTDAKTSLAYASITQLGIIFAEIGMGWTTLALIHIVGHSTIRTLQFLRAPSMLHEYHHMHAAAGGHIDFSGLSLESVLPETLRRRLYWFAMDRGHLDRFLDSLIIQPVLACSRLLLALDGKILKWSQPESSDHSGRPPSKEGMSRNAPPPKTEEVDA